MTAVHFPVQLDARMDKPDQADDGACRSTETKRCVNCIKKKTKKIQ